MDVTVAMKLFHAAMVALGYVYVDCVAPEPTKMPSWPGRSVFASVAFSPPTTPSVPLVFVTNPVWLLPKTNSRRKTNACRRSEHACVR